MEKKNQIGLVLICVLLYVVGFAFVSAAKDNPSQPWNQIIGMFITNTVTDPVPVSIEGPVIIETDETPDTKCVEIVYDGNAPADEIIYIDLSGYKELQLTYDLYLGSEGMVFLSWVAHKETVPYELDPPVLLWNWGDLVNQGHISTPVCGNTIQLRIVNTMPTGIDDIRIILYATK